MSYPWTDGQFLTATDLNAEFASIIARRPTLLDFGAIADGAHDCAAAIATAFASVSDVTLPAGTYAFLTSTIIPSGKMLRFALGAQLTVATGVTVTINGQIDAPIAQIFSGAGSVVGIRQVYPEWWGATGSGSGNDQPALQAAHTCVQGSLASDGGRPTIFLTRPQYQVATTWTVAPTANINLAIQGNGTIFSGVRIVAASTFAPGGPVVLIDGNTDGTQCISDWRFCDVGIVASAGGCGAANGGLQVGSTTAGRNLIGLQESKVEDVFIHGIPNGLAVIHTRLVQFNRVSVWNDGLGSANSAIVIYQNGGFTGDCTFNDCQFVEQKVASHNGLVIQSSVAGGHIAGIRFNGLIGYTSDQYVTISCSGGTKITDLWFNPGCQFDGGAINAIFVACIGASSYMSDIHFDHIYVDGATANMVTISTATGNNIQNVWVDGCWLSQAVGAAVVVGGTGLMTGLHVCNNTIDSCTAATGAISVVNVTGAEITGNVLTRSAVQTCGYVATLGSGCNYLVCTSNNSSGCTTSGVIQDLSGGIQKAVANNI